VQVNIVIIDICDFQHLPCLGRRNQKPYWERNNKISTNSSTFASYESRFCLFSCSKTKCEMLNWLTGKLETLRNYDVHI